MRIFSLAALLSALMFTSCSSDEPSTVQEPPTLATHTTIGVEEAIKIAENAFDSFFPDYQVSRSASSSIQRNNVVPILSHSTSRTANSDTLLYIVNREDNAGFAIVSAIPNTTALLGISDYGNITNIDSITNPGLSSFLDFSKMYVSDATPTITPEKPETLEIVTNIIADINVEPRLEVIWGQDDPAGDLCPNGLCGCGPLAFAIACSYLEEPKQIRLLYDNKNTDTPLDWAFIKLGLHDYTIAQFCRELGFRMNADYKNKDGEKSTGVNLYDFHYISKSILPENVGELREGMPSPKYLIKDSGVIIVCGYRMNENNKPAGHIWVIDGYRYYHAHTTEYVTKWIQADPNGNLWFKERSIFRETDSVIEYSHIDWGWNGQDNGYYNIDVYNTDYAREYDYGHVHHRNYTFDFSHFVVK